MKYILYILLLSFQFAMSQKDYSDQWQDLYSYNNVKDFTIVENKLYAVSDNAMFIYDIKTNDTQKFSSINGLSGNTTSSVYFDKKSSSVIIGYENGLIEIISEENKVTPLTGIRDNFILVNKEVKGFYRSQNQLYAYGGFGIIELNVKPFEFGEIFKLSNNDDSSYLVNQIVIESNVLYAATNNGLYKIDLASNLNPIKFENWTIITSGNIPNLLILNSKIYFTKGSGFFETTNPTISIIKEPSNILNLNIDESTGDLIVVMAKLVNLYETSTFTQIDQINLSLASNYNFTTTKAVIRSNEIFVNTTSFGILKTPLEDKINYTELHPDGPSANDIFSLTVSDNQKWIVYGGHNLAYNGLNKYRGVDYFIDGKWSYLRNNQIGSKKDYLKALVDPFDSSKTLIGSLRDGVIELNGSTSDFKYVKQWGKANTNDILPGHLSTGEAFVGNMIEDKNKMIWIANSRAKDNYFFSRYNGEKKGADRFELKIAFPKIEGKEGFVRGFNKMFVDKNNNVYAASARTGLFVFNANPINDQSKRKITILNDLENNGKLNSNYIQSVVVDENNKIWIGTNSGLVIFDDYEHLFSETKKPAKPLIIEENGIGEKFLSDIQINDIIIDLSGNKWFATQNAGVFQTSSDGQTTYNIFNTLSSPLPSNTIIDLELDKKTGQVYMVTEKGVLAYSSKNESFGTNITPVIAYPNPAIRNQPGHEKITIVSKDGKGIPDGTNVKIMDVSGKLVYETNINKETQSIGGKIVWDKTNLRGNSVVSGVYIVLLSSPDASESTTTKIAIIN